MAESKKHKKILEEQLTLTNELTTRVTTFGEYLVSKRIGISSDEAQELQGYVDTWRERAPDLSEAEAWSLIASVEEWAQARKAVIIAIAALVASVVVGLCSLCVSVCSLLVNMLSTR